VILDSSAIVAILLKEEGAEELEAIVAAAPVLGVGAPTFVESLMVLSSRFGRELAARNLEGFLSRSDAVVVSFTEDHTRAAAEAFARFGKGRHRAALNFGDCMSYAVAKLAGQPLLCTGSDFAKTDLKLA
jgi:ribonuclease VapC